MSESKVSIQFASVRNLWAFRKDIPLNAFFVNISKMIITFELPIVEIAWAIEKHYGQLVLEKQNA
jgi:hypothetical protein